MYQFASNRKLLDETHRDKLIEEIETIFSETEEDMFPLSCLWGHVHVTLNPEDWSHELVEWKTSRPFDGCAWEFNFGVLSRMNPGKTGIAPPKHLTIFTPVYVSSCIARNLHGHDLTQYVLRSLANGGGTDSCWKSYAPATPNFYTLCKIFMAERHLSSASMCAQSLGIQFSVTCSSCGVPVNLTEGRFTWASAFGDISSEALCEACAEEMCLTNF